MKKDFFNEEKITFAKVKGNAIIPTKRDEDAGYDLYACFDNEYIVINPLETKLIPTGIATAIPTDYYFQIEERSSTGSKGMKKSAGIIDSGYRNEIFVAVTNCNNKPLVITKESNTDYLEDDYIVYPYNKAIAQMILHRVHNLKTEEISYDDLIKISSERRLGALGSSGK